METFSLDGHPYIALCDLLKIQGWCHSGAAAKTAIYGQQVKVDGTMEPVSGVKSSLTSRSSF